MTIPQRPSSVISTSNRLFQNGSKKPTKAPCATPSPQLLPLLWKMTWMTLQTRTIPGDIAVDNPMISTTVIVTEISRDMKTGTETEASVIVTDTKTSLVPFTMQVVLQIQNAIDQPLSPLLFNLSQSLIMSLRPSLFRPHGRCHIHRNLPHSETTQLPILNTTLQN